MRRSFRYWINEEKGAAMLSLAFELKPNVAPPVDTTGMAKLELQPKKFPSESEIAIKLAESVANIRDVAAELSSDPALESAGYDRDAYLKWVSDGELNVEA
jgi:hypothetical protein